MTEKKLSARESGHWANQESNTFNPRLKRCIKRKPQPEAQIRYKSFSLSPLAYFLGKVGHIFGIPDMFLLGLPLRTD